MIRPKVIAFTISDKVGGANIGTARIFNQLIQEYPDLINYYVLSKLSTNYRIKSLFRGGPLYDKYLKIIQLILKKLLIKKQIYNSYFSFNIIPSLIDIALIIKSINVECIYLHWIGRGAISIYYFLFLALTNSTKKIVIKFADEFYLTGGCHYITDSNLFPSSDKLKASPLNILGQIIFQFQKKILHFSLSNLKNLSIITPSLWMFRRTKESLVFNNSFVKYIPNTVSVSNNNKISYKKNILDKSNYIFGIICNDIDDERKNLKFTSKLINNFSKYELYRNNIRIICVGRDSKKFINSLNKNIHKNSYALGSLDSDLMFQKFYLKIDLFLHLSLQDNAPNTIMEALINGVPVFTNNKGGNPEHIKDCYNGFIVNSDKVEANCEKLKSSLEILAKEYSKINKNCLSYSKNVFSLEIITKQYLNILLNDQ